VPDVSCPGCDEVIEIEPDWYDRKVACPSCGERFVVRRPGDDDEPPARPRKKVVADPDEDDEDDRPRKKKRRAKREEPPMPMGRGTKQLILVGAIVGPILLMCLGCGGWVAWELFGPVRYPDPWVSQSLPDGSFTVQFPKPPDSSPVGEGHGGAVGVKYLYEGDLPNAEEFAFGHLDGGPYDFDTTYRMEMDNLRDLMGAKVTREREVTSAGCRGKEMELTAGGAKVVYRILDASANGRRRYLLVLAGGRKVSDADRTKFLDSLTRGR
jgi:hypothetical protein